MSAKSSSSDESSEISDSAIDNYEAKSYLRLKAGNYKVKNSDGSYRCPFCAGKKKLNYLYKEILQHASGIGSSNRKGKMKADHCAYAKYFVDMADGAGNSLQLMDIKQEPSPRSKEEDQFVWPWMGVLMNLPTDQWKDGRHVGRSETSFKEQLREFHPLKVHPLWNFRGHIGSAIVTFSKDWSGFKDAMTFEKHFEKEHCGKMDWYEERSHKPGIYGWVARAEDYHSGGPVGEHLRSNGDLKTVADLTKEECQKNEKLVAELANRIEVKNKHIIELECKYNQSAMSHDKIMEDTERLIQAYNEDYLQRTVLIKKI
ncbi:hypothetical protein Taro_036995 [Colocasia esculenta]|uniref:Uncharacterized protein n=1 Tax=Colocasia esculenta TaxID=4460 RepID=A0A843W9X5_COLES|nr:hypothetical protein [Colocasia esculenta]